MKYFASLTVLLVVALASQACDYAQAIVVRRQVVQQYVQPVQAVQVQQYVQPIQVQQYVQPVQVRRVFAVQKYVQPVAVQQKVVRQRVVVQQNYGFSSLRIRGRLRFR